MFIKDLQPRQTNVEVEGEIIEMSDVREFSKFGKAGKVANAIIKDGTGTVKLSLWNEQIEKVKVGDTVKISKGYVGEYQGELQLTTGKFGTLEVGSSDSESAPPTADPVEETEEEESEPVVDSPAPEPKPSAPFEPDDTKKQATLDTTPAAPKKDSDDDLDVEEEDVI